MAWEIVIDDPQLINKIKNELQENCLFVKPIYKEGSKSIIRTSINDEDNKWLLLYGGKKRWYNLEFDGSNCSNKILDYTRQYLENHDYLQKELIDSVPLRYTIYPPLLLFNNSTTRSFNRFCWIQFFEKYDSQEFFAGLIRYFPRVTHVAINMPIIGSDTMRRPFQLYPLYGELFKGKLSDECWLRPTIQDFDNTLWCHTMQNGIHQYWAPIFTMFSRGNIKEKKRILDTFEEIQGNDVVDLYAGIGYFTLSYLKRGARNCFCFELNPWSTKALEKGIIANGFDPRNVHVYNEDNLNAPQRIEQSGITDLRIRHINLGLLPSSKGGWSIAQSIIQYQETLVSNHKVTLHIHENVHLNKIQNGAFVRDVIDHFSKDRHHSYKASHLERIKTFAPDVWHVCLDVDVCSRKELEI